MDEDKSREYRELVAKVKLKYRENPICKGNLRLGWCDLVPGEMNNGKDIMFHNNVNLSSRDSQTDTNLIQYFSWIGRPEIDKQRYSDLFFCNCNLGYCKDTYSGNMTRNILTNDSLEIKRLIDIIKPDNIISLGLDTSVVVI